MSTKFTKPLLTISLLTSLVAISATANAGATISDKRNWPNEVGPAAYRSISAQQAPRDAFAAFGWMAEPAPARGIEDGNAWHYLGGPKSSVPPSRSF